METFEVILDYDKLVFKINDYKLLKAFYGKLNLCGGKSGGSKEEVCMMRSKKYYLT